MTDPRAPRTAGIQRSTSAPDALGKAIQRSAYAQRATSAMGADGVHDHGDGGGNHEHEHVTSRLMGHDGRLDGHDGRIDGHDGMLSDHDARIANLEGKSGASGDGS